MPAAPTSWTPQSLPTHRTSRAPLIVAITVAVLALGVAVAARFKPTPTEAPAAPQYTEQQVADAKKNLCDAYDAALRAANNAGSARSEDPNQKFMISINTRLAFNTAADYLVNNIFLNPAAPGQLLNAAQNLASSYQAMILTQTAQATQEELNATYSAIDRYEKILKESCQ